MTVNVEILCVGNELLIGKIPNTNSHWLAKQATELGAYVKRITVIQDTVEEIAKTIHEATERKPQFIITTGGLGPTFDDKTFQGIAKALNKKLTVNPQALEMVRTKCVEYAKKLHLPSEVEMAPPRVKMATFPEKTQPVTNPLGTAPALRADLDGAVLFALPGVPAEMKAIFNQTIAPLIKVAAGRVVFCQRSVFVEGIFESRLSPLIDMVMTNNVGVYIKSHPLQSNKIGIELHLTIIAEQDYKPDELLLQATKQLASLVGANGGRIMAGK